MAAADYTPVIIGAGQQTWRETDATRTPTDALEVAARAALEDCGATNISSLVDAVCTVRFIADTTPEVRGLFPREAGAEVAARTGITNAALFQGSIGGNTPQYLVNHFARALAVGEHQAVLLAGAENLATMFAAFRGGDDLSAWPGPGTTEPATIGVEREGINDSEKAHGLYEPINTYPLFENSLRHHLGLTRETHTALIAGLSSDMSRVAGNNPHAWKPVFETSEDISSVDIHNRYIGYPYTRAMNPILAVDMAAAIVLTTAGNARALGVDEAQWVYLRGGADCNDTWYVSERPQLHASPAVRGIFQAISAHTGITVDEIGHFDIYSCFPSAVQVACREIGLDPRDPRGVTVTGGLPYFGGPGNNYSLHAIAEMAHVLRAKGGHGLVTANGLYLTKHSVGLYSREAPQDHWQAINSAPLQSAVDAIPLVPLAVDATGPATVETFTVAFGREGPKQGIVIARNDAGERIVANTGDEEETLTSLLDEDPIGQRGNVTVENGINRLTL